MEYVGEEIIVENDDNDGGWVETHHFDDGGNNLTDVEEKICEMTLDSSKYDDINNTDEDNTQNIDGEAEDDDNDDEEGEAADMEEFEESGMLEMVDPATATTSRNKPMAADMQKPLGGSTIDPDYDSVIHTRTYDLHISYDKYYQTPRLWVVGYDENRKPLTVDQMYEDVSQDHAKKTVTMESHPHLPGPNMASVHPCKYVIKNITYSIIAFLVNCLFMYII